VLLPLPAAFQVTVTVYLLFVAVLDTATVATASVALVAVGFALSEHCAVNVVVVVGYVIVSAVALNVVVPFVRATRYVNVLVLDL
jgi:hypothetical protein